MFYIPSRKDKFHSEWTRKSKQFFDHLNQRISIKEYLKEIFTSVRDIIAEDGTEFTNKEKT